MRTFDSNRNPEELQDLRRIISKCGMEYWQEASFFVKDYVQRAKDLTCVKRSDFIHSCSTQFQFNIGKLIQKLEEGESLNNELEEILKAEGKNYTLFF